MNSQTEFKAQIDVELSSTEQEDLKNFFNSDRDCGDNIEEYCITHQKFITDFEHEKTDNCEVERFADLLKNPDFPKSEKMKLTHRHISFIKNQFSMDFEKMEIFRCSDCLHEIRICSSEYYQHILHVFEYKNHKLRKIREYEFMDHTNPDENARLREEKRDIVVNFMANTDEYEFYCKNCDTTYNVVSSHELYLNCKDRDHERFIRYPIKKKNQNLNRLVADSIISMNPIITVRETNELRMYRNGVYSEYPEESVKSLIEKLVIAPNISLKREIIDSIKSVTYRNLAEFDTNPNILNLQNGLFNLETEILLPHTPDHLSFIQYQVKFDPTAKCSTFDNFIQTSIPEEKMRIWALEALSLILIPKLNIKKALFTIGAHDAGKSKLLSVAEMILGVDNFSSLTVHQIEEDRFCTSSLVGKCGNVSHDISNSKVLTSSTFKNLIDRRSIFVQKKGANGFNSSFNIQYIFSLNTAPEISEEASEGFFNRVIPIVFPLQFKVNPTKEDLVQGILPADPELESKLNSELPGIFNKLLTAVKKVKKQNSITNLPNPEEIEKLWRGLSNPIQNWLDARTVRMDTKAFVTLEDFYRDYMTWTGQRGERVYSKLRFLKLADKQFDSSHRLDPRFTTNSRCYVGVHISDIGRHDNLVSYDSEFITKIESAKENFNFNENGLLQCKKCLSFENLQTAREHKCNKTLDQEYVR